MNNRNILKHLYNLISTIDNIYINIFIEEIYEDQTELHLKKNKVKKRNVESGARVIIAKDGEKKYKSISFSSYEDMFYQVINYIQKTLTLKLINQDKKISFKKINDKKCLLSNQQKYRIMASIMEKLKGYDSLKVAFYERKENIFIIQNTNKYILNVKKIYTKVMLKGNVKDTEIFDFELSDHGYKNLTKTNIMRLVRRFKEISSIKTNGINISDGNYDLILSNHCGTIFHEVLGHNLELDLKNKISLGLFKKGNDLGNNLITYIDNTHCSRNLLNIKYDDYSNKTHNKVLINNGIVRNYITTSRSENYKYFPSTRMTNSYLKPNKKALKIDLTRVKNGIYIYKIKSGKLYLEDQKFEVIIDVGYLIRDGKMVGGVSNLVFLVDVLSFIKKINYVGNDLCFVPTMCGASSGNVFAYVGAPTVYIKDIKIINRAFL